MLSSTNYITPDLVGAASTIVFAFTCKHGHHFQKPLCQVTSAADNGSRYMGCPECAGTREKQASKSLSEAHPELAVEYIRRKGSPPASLLSARDRRVFFWGCPAHPGFEYAATISARALGQGCPLCFLGQRVDASLYAKAREQYDLRDVNLGFNFRALPPRYKVFWKCAHKHSFYESFEQLKARDWQCPKCIRASIRRLSDYQDLFAQFHPSLNDPYDPAKLRADCRSDMWWQCRANHAWKAPVHARTLLGEGCPFCADEKAQEKPIVIRTKTANVSRLKTEESKAKAISESLNNEYRY